MSTVRLEKLSKRFGDLLAVDAVDLEVAAGEVLCLLGPSGCGKTTTLRMVAGLESASDGDIYLADRRVNDLSARQRNVAMAFQFYALYPSLKVADNLAYPLHAEKLGRREIRERVQVIAKTLELEPVLDRLPGQLAEGEKQRVAVGRAIIREPNCFLFDEPLSRLDVELRQTMRGQIKEVLAGLSKATVIVTHDQLEALTMADRIAVMSAGKIEQVASPHDIFAKPQNLFVAGFIGTPQMNLLAARYLRREQNLGWFEFGGQRFAADLGPGARRLDDALTADAEVTVGVRPRAFELCETDTAGALCASVDLIEPMGAETLLHLLHEDRDLRLVLRRDRAVANVGERAWLRCKPEQAHLFDHRGNRIELK